MSLTETDRAEAVGAIPVRRLRKGSLESDRLRQKAAEFFGKGMGYKACAGILGISQYTARDWLHEYRSGRLLSEREAVSAGQGRKREPGPDDRSRAQRLRDDGLSYNEIAEALGLSRSTVRSWLRPERRQVVLQQAPRGEQLDLFSPDA